MILRRLRYRFRARRPYRVFTTDFDQEIRAGELLADIDRAPSAAAPASVMDQDRSPGEALADALASKSLSELAIGSADRVVLLIDHSGSMKGAPIAAARTMAEQLAIFFEGRGVPCEILGYTTRNWRGGDSRQRWIESGRPRNPGRLCDLRHLVYRGFGDDGDWRDALRLMSMDILREGVDGEAVEWAASRMPEASPQGRRVIIQIGDGSPADDSTQQANGPWILEDHFIEATARVRSGGCGYLLLTFRLWEVDIPQVAIGTDPVKCASEIAGALHALFERRES